jgi:hypothetical protein
VTCDLLFKPITHCRLKCLTTCQSVAQFDWKRKKMADDEVKDVDPEWTLHPLRDFLRLEMVAGNIPLATKGEMNYKAVWNKYCDDWPDLFKGMECDDLFNGRVRSLRQQTSRDFKRRDADQLAYDIHRQNFPASDFDRLGQPKWEGSDAKKLLVADIKAKLYPHMKPEILHTSRPEYMQFDLAVFRGHIHQTIKTTKYLHTMKKKDEEKKAKKQEAAEKKKKRAAKKAEKEATAEIAREKKQQKDAEKLVKMAERTAKNAEKEAARAAKIAEKALKAATKALKEAAKMAKKKDAADDDADGPTGRAVI